MKNLPFDMTLTFGILLTILGLVFFLLYPRAKKNSNIYKEKQLNKYRKLYNKPYIKYEQTGLFLPAWQKVKFFAPMFFGFLFLLIGVSLLLTLL